MRYEILGPLRVTDEHGASFINARKIEILLAVLLARADEVVPTGALMTEIWGEGAPRRAVAGLHVFVSQLRKFLGRPGRPSSPVITRPPGYLLSLDADEFDAHLYLKQMEAGRAHAAAARHEQAADCLGSALALWRGPVLNGFCPGPILEGFVSWLTEARLDCTELLVDSQLALGRHRELVGRLYSLTAEHPLRESFYRQLMLALYRSDRQADALKVYQAARRTLNEELGLEPCRALQEVQRAVLRADDHLATAV
jgi:DNA-binding SARP family transcriptional activator